MADEVNTLLRSLVDTRGQVQKNRIQMGNRLSALEQGADESEYASQKRITQELLEAFQGLEKRLDTLITDEVEEYDIYDHVSAVKGVGPMLAAKLISMIDIQRADTVSALWRYAGYAVIDGERERPRKGEKLHYNSRVKTTCYNIAQSMLRSRSPYRSEYDDAKIYYLERNLRWQETRAAGGDAPKPWTKGHIHMASLRKMIKLFLSHLWVRWRTLEGLPTRAPYVHEYEGHTSLQMPVEYGWPEIEGEMYGKVDGGQG